MTIEHPDTSAVRILATAALVTIGIALAVSGLAWSIDVRPGVPVVALRPPAGNLPAFVLMMAVAVALFRVREQTWRGQLRAAMWTSFGAGVAAMAATVFAVGLLVPVALGSAAALALLAASAGYEALHRDPLPPDVVAAATARLDAVMRPPEVLYYI